MNPAAAKAPDGARVRRVGPLVASLALLALFAGLWAGLLRLGLPLPTGRFRLAEAHGPLMTLGFLGTLVALERAVALRRWWTLLAPLASGAGGLALLVGAPERLGPFLLTLAGGTLTLVYLAVYRIQPSWHAVVMGGGAACWVLAAGLLLLGWDVSRTVPWLAGFLVLTIAGERLELTRFLAPVPAAPGWFGLAVAALLAGLAVSVVAPVDGVRLAGVGLLGLAGWLATHDLARRTVHSRGVTRFMAVALLTGYAWLGVAGGLWLAVGRMADGPAYDAMLHALFLGFVMSMVLAHAPVVVPAVLGRPLPYRQVMYAPLLLLHASLLLRLVGGDGLGNRLAWQSGGVLNEVALLLLLGLIAVTARQAQRTPARRTLGAARHTEQPVTVVHER